MRTLTNTQLTELHKAIVAEKLRRLREFVKDASHGRYDKPIAKSSSTYAHEGARRALGGLRKRALDIALVSIALIMLMPILLAIAGLIRLLISKSVVVKNERIGFGGKAFACYEFCSAAPRCDDTSSALLRLNDPFWPENFGYMLRASGLDKLPLLFSVLRGDMSLIGPRPITADEVSRHNRLMPKYFTARPGITGLWRHTRKPASDMALDRYYIRYWSVGLDITLSIKAMSAVA